MGRPWAGSVVGWGGSLHHIISVNPHDISQEGATVCRFTAGNNGVREVASRPDSRNKEDPACFPGLGGWPDTGAQGVASAQLSSGRKRESRDSSEGQREGSCSGTV